jgi:hypothetical protein
VTYPNVTSGSGNSTAEMGSTCTAKFLFTQSS